MNIKTKFNLGDKLYKVSGNKIIGIEITGIDIVISAIAGEDKYNTRVDYYFEDLRGQRISEIGEFYSEEKLIKEWYKTPEEATKHLLDKYYDE